MLNADTLLIRKRSIVPSVSVLTGFDCSMLLFFLLFSFFSFLFLMMFICHIILSFCRQVIAKKLQSDFLSSFVKTLLEGLADCQSHSSSGSCVVLNSIVRIRGQELRQDVSFYKLYYLLKGSVYC